MTYPAFNKLAPGYTRLWADLAPRPEHADALKAICTQLLEHKPAYQAIAQTVWGGPDAWFVPAIIDQMEHDPDLGLTNSHLHNGDPLTARTVDVPAGRPPRPAKPPFTFSESAVDALRFEGLDQVAVWTVERLAYWLERYNGEGYLSKPIENPYLAAWSNLYTAGKFTSDHHYDPAAVSKQPGALVILKTLITLDPTVGAALAPAQPKETTTVTTTTQAPAAPTIAVEVDQILHDVNQVLPYVVGGVTLFVPNAGPFTAIFLKAFQQVVNAADIVAADTGKPLLQTLQDVINHLTPGQPNSAALS